jgi:hypothetical protein
VIVAVAPSSNVSPVLAAMSGGVFGDVIVTVGVGNVVAVPELPNHLDAVTRSVAIAAAVPEIVTLVAELPFPE